VLRITVPKGEGRPLFILDGRLTADWVGELLFTTREILPGTNCAFDIEDGHFVDLLGERALQWLNHLGATFVALNTYRIDLCERPQLRRRAGETRARQGSEDMRRSAET
jgi:hypothetical protein